MNSWKDNAYERIRENSLLLNAWFPSLFSHFYTNWMHDWFGKSIKKNLSAFLSFCLEIVTINDFFSLFCFLLCVHFLMVKDHSIPSLHSSFFSHIDSSFLIIMIIDFLPYCELIKLEKYIKRRKEEKVCDEEEKNDRSRKKGQGKWIEWNCMN